MSPLVLTFFSGLVVITPHSVGGGWYRCVIVQAVRVTRTSGATLLAEVIINGRYVLEQGLEQKNLGDYP